MALRELLPVPGKGSSAELVGDDDRDVHAGGVGQFAVGGNEGRAIEAAGGDDVKGVMHGEVVAQLPSLDEQRCDGDDGEGPLGEDVDELRGALVVEDAGEGVSSEDLGDLQVEVFDGP